MLKISIIDTSSQRRLVLEGKLITPWTIELRTACEKARDGLDGRELVIYLKNLTVISQEGQNLLATLMNEGVKFRCSGVLAKEVVSQLARKRDSRTFVCP
jgi:hypothetical protein